MIIICHFIKISIYVNKMVISALVVLNCYLLCSAITYECPNKIHTCLCYNNTGVAKCSNLTEIPEFPRSINTIVFYDNTFQNISKDFIQNLTKINLLRLTFHSNSINNIDGNSFSDLHQLKRLVISGENKLSVEVVMTALKKMNGRLKVLVLKNNQWQTIPTLFFNASVLNKIKEVDFSGNYFSHFPFDELSHFKQLKTINLEENKIIHVRTKNKVGVKTLDLKRNNIADVYSFCVNKSDNISDNKESNSYFPNLMTLHLDRNGISTLYPGMFRCLPNLQTLTLNGNRFNVIPKDFLFRLPKIKRVSIRYMNNPSHIQPLAFRSSSLSHLNIGTNGFHFEKKGRFDLAHIFKDIPNLRKLDLSDSFFPNDSEIKLMKIFKHLKTLTYLNLQGSYLTFISKRVFQIFSDMKTLILNSNEIRTIEDGAFENMTSIKELHLGGNRLQLINESTFPLDNLPSLKRIQLSNNPFACTCNQMWFLKWVHDKNKSKLLVGFPNGYICNYPEQMRGIHLIDYKPTTKSCKPWNPYYTIAISISSFCVLVFFAIVVVYKCNLNIRNCFYLIHLRKLKRKGYLQLDNQEDFEYHAFVIYCKADGDWVHKVLLPKLDEQCIRLCIHMRDFDVGGAISENVFKYLNKSWKVVIIMSNSFAKNDWCQWETEFVHERRRRQGKEAIVLIMLKNIDSNHMTSSIKAMIDTTPYLTYTKGIGEDLFWRTVIESIRRPLNNPPIAV